MSLQDEYVTTDNIYFISYQELRKVEWNDATNQDC